MITRVKKALRAALCLIFAVLMLAVLVSCGEKYEEATFFAMDTVISIKSDNAEAIKAAEKRIGEIESVISKTAEGSDVSLSNTDIDILIDVSDDFSAVVSRAIEISEATDGAFDVTVGILKELWEKCASLGHSPTEQEIKNALTYVSPHLITLDDDCLEKAFKQVRIDLGAIGKGYAAEEAVKAMKDAGAESGILSLGGNVAVFGEKKDGRPYKVAVKNPLDPEKSLGNILLGEGFVSVSGDYERYIEILETGEKFCHIIDPKTGSPVADGVHSVAVTGKDGTLCDALSTALFVMGKDKAIEFYEKKIYDFEFIIVTDDGVFASAGLEGKFDKARSVDVTYVG